MRVSEASKLAARHGCTLKPAGYGMWKVVRAPDNWGYITKSELNRTNEAKFVSFYIPEERA